MYILCISASFQHGPSSLHIPISCAMKQHFHGHRSSLEEVHCLTLLDLFPGAEATDWAERSSFVALRWHWSGLRSTEFPLCCQGKSARRAGKSTNQREVQERPVARQPMRIKNLGSALVQHHRSCPATLQVTWTGSVNHNQATKGSRCGQEQQGVLLTFSRVNLRTYVQCDPALAWWH